MAQNQRTTTVLDSLGEEIVRIVTPVSICMLAVVILVSILSSDSSISSASFTSMATIAYSESSSDSSWDKFKGALLNSLAFVVLVTVVTFVLVFLFYIKCTKFLKLYMGFSAFVVLALLGGEVSIFLIEDFSVPIDCFTFSLGLLNFSVVGVLAVFMSKMAIIVTQGYMVLIGILVAYSFTLLPEWTTWVLLVAMALYDLAAVLLPVGPLRLLVELAISRDEDIPALVYEARPVTHDSSNSATAVAQRRVWRDRRAENSNSLVSSHLSVNRIGDDSNLLAISSPNVNAILDSISNLTVSSGRADNDNLVRAEEGQIQETDSPSAPLIEHRMTSRLHGQHGTVPEEGLMLEGMGLGSSGAIKLGLGDFIFYSVLVGRAAMYDFMTVYACYLAIIAGLGITLMLLALYQKALPALPVSVMLGVLFYLLTRFLLEVFVVQCSLNLLMF